MSEMNIYQRINAVMKEVEYVQKDASIAGGGANYKAVTHDMVTAVVRKSMVAHGIVIEVEQKDSELLIKRDVDSGVKMHLYSGTYAVSFINIDNGMDRLTSTINAHANDNGDKAPGKAASYAVKYAMLKTFTLETGENEESRTYEAPEYTDLQKNQLDELLEADNALGFVCFSKTVGNDVMSALNGSFVKGTISQAKAKMKKLDHEGWNVLRDYAEQVKSGIESEDNMAIGQLIDEMEPVEKKLLAGLLTQTEIAYLKDIK